MTPLIANLYSVSKFSKSNLKKDPWYPADFTCWFNRPEPAWLQKNCSTLTLSNEI
jgi:hypothetical protein